MTRNIVLAFAIVICVAMTAPVASLRADEAPAKTAPTRELPWLGSLDEAYKQALHDERPILVYAGAVWCGPCHQFKAELAKPAVQEQLAAHWTCVYIDVDKSPEAARSLAVEAIPALRVLSANGAVAASSEGFMSAEQFLDWLQTSAKTVGAAMPPPQEFLGSAEPSQADAQKLIKALLEGQPALHEAAIHRLRPFPRVAASA